MKKKSNQEKYLEVEKRASEEINSFLIRGTTKLKVQKVCLGLDGCVNLTGFASYNIPQCPKLIFSIHAYA
jgi:hypothetical protein